MKQMREPKEYVGERAIYIELRETLRSYMTAHDPQYVEPACLIEQLGRQPFRPEHLVELAEDLPEERHVPHAAVDLEVVRLSPVMGQFRCCLAVDERGPRRRASVPLSAHGVRVPRRRPRRLGQWRKQPPEAPTHKKKENKQLTVSYPCESLSNSGLKYTALTPRSRKCW